MTMAGKTNRVVRVTFTGGLIGLLFGSSRGRVEAAIQKENAVGWNLAHVIPDQPNLAIWIVRLALLVLTLGLWTLSTGYLFIFERPRGEVRPEPEKDVLGRASPPLTRR